MDEGAPFLVSVHFSSFITQNFPLLSSKCKDNISNPDIPQTTSLLQRNFSFSGNYSLQGLAAMKLHWVYVWKMKELSGEHKASYPLFLQKGDKREAPSLSMEWETRCFMSMAAALNQGISQPALHPPAVLKCGTIVISARWFIWEQWVRCRLGTPREQQVGYKAGNTAGNTVAVMEDKAEGSFNVLQALSCQYGFKKENKTNLLLLRKAVTVQSLKYPRPGGTGLWATWGSGRCPRPMAELEWDEL